MTYSILNNIELKRYLTLVSDETSEGVVLALFDNGNNLFDVCSSMPIAPEECKKVVFDNNNNSSLNVNYRKCFLTASGETLATVYLLSKNNKSVISDKKLDAVFSCMANECQLYLELDGLTEELQSKYEELNLVYNEEDTTSTHTLKLVEDMLESCSSYIRSSFIGVYLPKHSIKMCLEDSNSSGPVSFNKLLSICCSSKHSDMIYVINSDDNELCQQLPELQGKKSIILPLRNHKSDTFGVLYVSRNKSDADFVNSDKNLLDVIAKKIVKRVYFSHDELTGVYNRHFFEKKISALLSDKKNFSVLYIDIDDLQLVNDSYGYGVGDHVITSMARFLKSQVRKSDFLSYQGSGQFSVLLQDCEMAEAKQIARKMRSEISQLTLIEYDDEFQISATIGVSKNFNHLKTADAILSSAQSTCKNGKSEKTNSVYIYHPSGSLIESKRNELLKIKNIQDAITNNRFTLFCQQIAPIEQRSDELCVEVLIRMISDADQSKIISPIEFIPIAEKYYLMYEIDKWVISNTFKLLADTLTSGSRIPDKTSINLSGQSLGETDFLDYITLQFEKWKIPYDKICFEITESTAITHLDKAVYLVNSLNKLGCQISLDDFGAGLSSFAYLKDLNIDSLKIDGQFIKSILTDPVSKVMVVAMVELAKSLGLSTVAEFVCNSKILLELERLNVTYVQGFYVHKPECMMAFLDALNQPGSISNMDKQKNVG